MTIAVAGATGRTGRLVVDVLLEHGHEVVPISRSSGTDLVTGAGLAEALQGVECVIDTSNSPSSQQKQATEFFTAVGRNVQRAGERAGVQRLVVLSIIGCDRFGAGYYVAKTAHEEASLAGPVPALVLRSAQFHEFVGQSVESGRTGEMSRVRAMQTQPVEAAKVAETLAGLATGPFSEGGERLEIAGPQAEELVELAKLLVSRRGDPIRIEAVSDPADPDRDLYESGGLLPGPDAMLVGLTFEDWLCARL